MNTIAIDTYKTINKLKAKGFTEAQAEGLVDALTESGLVTSAPHPPIETPPLETSVKLRSYENQKNI